MLIMGINYTDDENDFDDNANSKKYFSKYVYFFLLLVAFIPSFIRLVPLSENLVGEFIVFE